jgi:hypothetical protein
MSNALMCHWNLWPNRDPIQEKGGNNLYEFVRNSPINQIDLFGQWSLFNSEPAVYWAPAPCPAGQLTAYIQVAVNYIWSKGSNHCFAQM